MQKNVLYVMEKEPLPSRDCGLTTILKLTKAHHNSNAIVAVEKDTSYYPDRGNETISHLREVQLSITNANPELLKEAIRFIAQELGCTETEFIYDYYARNAGNTTQQKVLAGMKHEQLCPGGYGVTIKDGTILVIGDPHLETSEYSNPKQYPFEKFQQKVKQIYPMIMTRREVKKLGYTTQIKPVGNKYQLECVRA